MSTCLLPRDALLCKLATSWVQLYKYQVEQADNKHIVVVTGCLGVGSLPKLSVANLSTSAPLQKRNVSE